MTIFEPVKPFVTRPAPSSFILRFMKDEAEAALIRSYRGTVESYRRLVDVAEQLVEAQRGGRRVTPSELENIEKQLANGREQVNKIDRYLAMWPDSDDLVH